MPLREKKGKSLSLLWLIFIISFPKTHAQVPDIKCSCNVSEVSGNYHLDLSITINSIPDVIAYSSKQNSGSIVNPFSLNLEYCTNLVLEGSLQEPQGSSYYDEFPEEISPILSLHRLPK